MRIAHVVRQYYPSIGGFEEVVRNLCKAQKQDGHAPYVVTLDRYFKALDKKLPAKEVIEGIEVIRIPFFGSTRYPIAPSVLKHIQQADLVHVHAIDFFYDFFALTKCIHRKPLVATTHGGFFHTTYASGMKKVFFNTVTRFSSLFYKKIIGSSENDGLLFDTIVSSNKLQVIENGVDLEKLNVAEKNNYPPALLYFGRWSSNKGLDETLHFFKSLVDNDALIGWKLIIAGRPYDFTYQDIVNKVSHLDLSQNVSIVENPDLTELKALTLKASYFISMSKFEGFGIAPIEAMSAGLTPVLNAIPPFRKLVKNTGQGILIDDHHQDVSKLVKHYQQGDFAHKQLQTSIQQYHWRDVHQHYLNAYEA